MFVAGFVFVGCMPIVANPVNTNSKDASIYDGRGLSVVTLVSLVFPLEDGINEVKVDNMITSQSIPFEFARTDERMVITLKLVRNELANPRIAFNGDTRYKALITPTHALETFEGCELDGSTIFLRDYGVEWTLQTGETETIPEKEFTRLWVAGNFVRAVRFTYSGGDEVQVSGGKAMPILNTDFIAVPDSGVEKISLSVVAR